MAMGTSVASFAKNAKSKLLSAKDEVEDYLTPAKLEKAKLFVLKKGLTLGEFVTVQFNPSQYQIARQVKISTKRAIGRDQDLEKMQAVCGEFATLSVSLYFDTITKLGDIKDLAGSLKGNLNKAGLTKLGNSAKASLTGKDKTNPTESGKGISQLLRYNDEEHAPLKVRFLWGTLDFIGYVVNSNISYTMFAPDGTPIRAKVDLTISGEEAAVFQKKMQLTFSSPNRTKSRVLTEGDQLWMLAQQEYDDPSQWRAIAEANGILNPRRITGAVQLKVPSIK